MAALLHLIAAGIFAYASIWTLQSPIYEPGFRNLYIAIGAGLGAASINSLASYVSAVDLDLRPSALSRKLKRLPPEAHSAKPADPGSKSKHG